MHLMKKFHALLLIVVVISLTACGSSLVKPTGLEDQAADHQITQNDHESEAESIEEDLEEIDENSEKIDDLKEDNVEQPTENKVDITEEQQSQASEQVKKESDQTTSDSKQTKKKEKKKEQTKSTDPSTKKSKTKIENDHSDKKDETVHSSNKPNRPKKETKDQTSTDDKKETPKKENPKQPGEVVTYSIVISEDEIPLSPTKMEIKPGDSVLQALIHITKSHKIQMDYRGGQGSTAYIEGIANVYEFDRGQGSGWMYRINGSFPDRGAGAVTLCDGDKVEWLYTTNLGQDLQADLKPVRRDGTCPN